MANNPVTVTQETEPYFDGVQYSTLKDALQAATAAAKRAPNVVQQVWPPPYDVVYSQVVNPPPPGFQYLTGYNVEAPVFGALPTAGTTWTCPETGATVNWVTGVMPDVAGLIGWGTVYSRYSPESSDKAYLLQHAKSNDGSIYSATTRFSDNTSVLNKDGNGTPIGEINELRWDYTGKLPTTFRFVQGMQFYSQDVLTGKSTLIRDFTNDFPGAQRIINGVEGDSSADSRSWAWMAQHYVNGNWETQAIFTYDLQTNTIVGQYAALPAAGNGNSSPNMVDIAPDGSGIVIDWATKQDNAPDHDGPHFYPLDLDVSKAVKVGYGPSHSIFAMGTDGVAYFISQNNSNDNFEAVNTKTGAVIVVSNLADFGWANGTWHFGKGYGVPGYFMAISAYVNETGKSYNQILLFKIAANTAPLNVTNTYNLYDGSYVAECYGAPSMDMLRYYWPCNYDGKAQLGMCSTNIPADFAKVFA